VSLFESPRAFAADGSLVTWVTFLLLHGATALMTVLTIAVLVLRLMILSRQWRQGK
jgi:cellobiose-specific phosphotransferase system component IIA